MADNDDEIQEYINKIENGDFGFLNGLQPDEIADALLALGHDLENAGDAGKAALSKLGDHVKSAGNFENLIQIRDSNTLSEVKDKKELLEMYGADSNGVYFTRADGQKADVAFNTSLDNWKVANPAYKDEELEIEDHITRHTRAREKTLDSIGAYEPQTMEQQGLSPKRLRQLVDRKELNTLTPEQLVSASNYFGSLTAAGDARYKDAFREHAEAVIEAFGNGNLELPGIESAPAMLEFLKLRGRDTGGFTASGLKAADRLANVVRQFDKANFLENVGKTNLAEVEANLTAIEGFSGSFDPFAVDENVAVPELEIAELTTAEAKAKLAKPEDLSLNDLAAIDLAMQKDLPAFSAEHQQVRDLMSKAISDVASGKVKVGKDTAGMKHILEANVSLRGQEVYKQADSKRYEALLENQSKKPLLDKDFEELRDTMNAMDFRGDMGTLGRKALNAKKQEEIRQSILEAAKLEATRRLAGKKDGISEEDWKLALKDSLHNVLFEVYTADQAAKGNTNAEKVAEDFSKLAELGKSGKKVRINRDSVAATMAATEKAMGSFQARLQQKTGKAAFCEKLNNRIRKFDQNCSKRFGKNYEKAKGVLKFVGKAAWGAAKNYGMYAVAASIAPVGIPALMAYNMIKKGADMRKDYLKKKEKNPDMKLKDYWKSREAILGMAGVALSAGAAVIPGMQLAGAENLSEVCQMPWVKALNAARPMIGMGLATVPKAFDALTAKKGERKKAWKDFAAAAGGIVTGYLLNVGIQGAAANFSETHNEPSAADHAQNQTVDEKTNTTVHQEANEGPKYVYDKENGASVIHDDPNQAAFERGEYDQANQAAKEAQETTAQQQSHEDNSTAKTTPHHNPLTDEAHATPEADAVREGVAAGTIIEGENTYGKIFNRDSLVQQTELMYAQNHSGVAGEYSEEALQEFDWLVSEGRIDEAREFMAQQYKDNTGQDFQGSELKSVMDGVLGIHAVVDPSTGVSVDYSLENGQLIIHGEPTVEHNPALDQIIKEGMTKEGEMYSLGGAHSMNPDLLIRSHMEEIKQLELKDAIYTDMAERAQLGDHISDEEKLFMENHVKELAEYGLTHEDIAGRDTLGQEAAQESRTESAAQAKAEAQQQAEKTAEAGGQEKADEKGQTATTQTSVHDQEPVIKEQGTAEKPHTDESQTDKTAEQQQKDAQSEEDKSQAQTSHSEEKQQDAIHTAKVQNQSVSYMEEDGKVIVAGNVAVNNDLREQMLAEAREKYQSGEMSASQYDFNREKALLEAKEVQLADAVYTDISERQAALQPISEAEKEFLQHHQQTMEKLGREPGSLTGPEDKLGHQAAEDSRAESAARAKADAQRAKELDVLEKEHASKQDVIRAKRGLSPTSHAAAGQDDKAPSHTQGKNDPTVLQQGASRRMRTK